MLYIRNVPSSTGEGSLFIEHIPLLAKCQVLGMPGPPHEDKPRSCAGRAPGPGREFLGATAKGCGDSMETTQWPDFHKHR